MYRVMYISSSCRYTELLPVRSPDSRREGGGWTVVPMEDTGRSSKLLFYILKCLRHPSFIKEAERDS